jgi:pectinesterase
VLRTLITSLKKMAISNDGSNSGKKKFAIIGVSSIILVAMVVAVAVGIGGSPGDSKQESSPKG